MTREEFIKSEYREYQHRATGIDIWEEGAFRAGFEAALKLSLPPAEGARKVQWSGYGELGNISQKPLQPTAEGAETIKQALCDDIEKSLNSAKMKHILSDDGEVLPFVDFMSTGDTIAEGREEIENIVEQIYFDMDSWPSLAALHAQRIADKMVSERLREELIAYDKHNNYIKYQYLTDFGDTSASMAVDEYLNTREK